MSEQIKHSIDKVAKYLYEFWGLKKNLPLIQTQFLSGKGKEKKMGQTPTGIYDTEEIIITDDVIGRIDFLPSLGEEITHTFRMFFYKPTDIQVEEFFGRLGYLYMCDKMKIPYKPYCLVESSVKKYREPIKGYREIMAAMNETHSNILTFLQEGLTILKKSNDTREIRNLYRYLSNHKIRKLYTLDSNFVQENLDKASNHLSKANGSKFHLYKGRKILWKLMKNLVDTFEMEKLKLDMAIKIIEMTQTLAEHDIEEHRGYEIAEKYYSEIKNMRPEERYSLLFSKPEEIRKKFFN